MGCNHIASPHYTSLSCCQECPTRRGDQILPLVCHCVARTRSSRAVDMTSLPRTFHTATVPIDELGRVQRNRDLLLFLVEVVLVKTEVMFHGQGFPKRWSDPLDRRTSLPHFFFLGGYRRGNGRSNLPANHFSPLWTRHEALCATVLRSAGDRSCLLAWLVPETLLL